VTVDCQLDLFPDRADRATEGVIGCVWGAHRTLAAELGDAAPSYRWCEDVFNHVRRHAPPPGPDLPVWLLRQLRWLLGRHGMWPGSPGCRP
jgi:hypothetical protein